eukprot:TRINITY_DN44279_c0_g1_i1.p1 TRINITY_DN44279_c0_g1~~TRINITY_DN44279_c0_g1_i1.p1  ORF type:complete len:776 (-),score=199.59 TRINITY_DN44279_c0_g1_i1:106-2349(-)
MAPRRKGIRRGVPAQKFFKKPVNTGGRTLRDQSSASSTGSSSRSGDEDTCSSECECSDEDDPRDYKRGGYHPVTPFQLYNARYRVLSKLGAGAFSTVWLCADEKSLGDGGPDLVAMKVCKSKKSVTEQALDEIYLLERLQDDSMERHHVVQMRGHFWHSGPNGRHKCVVFEVMGENLLALVKHHDYNGMSINMCRRLAKHTLTGLAYIHSRGVIHTDVKLENVLVQRHDYGELVSEAHRAHKAFMDQRQGMSSMTKSQKKKMKKRQKNAKAKGEEEGEVAGFEEVPEAASASAAAAPTVEGATEKEGDMTAEDEAAAKACGRPIPPVRQRDRFDTLRAEKVLAFLADFGNGCQADKKVTDDIQTRQYRSPEVIIGQEWDETADVWSAACMFFELITGDFLFNPRTGKDWSRDEDHLALMTELLCSEPPKEWVLQGKYARDFFSNSGKLKHIKKLKYWSLKDVLMEKYSHSTDEATEVADFLLPMLTWEPKKRQSAAEALKHPWLHKWDDEESDESVEETESGEDDEGEHTGAEGSAEKTEAASSSSSPVLAPVALVVEALEITTSISPSDHPMVGDKEKDASEKAEKIAEPKADSVEKIVEKAEGNAEEKAEQFTKTGAGEKAEEKAEENVEEKVEAKAEKVEEKGQGKKKKKNKKNKGHVREEEKEDEEDVIEVTETLESEQAVPQLVVPTLVPPPGPPPALQPSAACAELQAEATVDSGEEDEKEDVPQLGASSKKKRNKKRGKK